MTRTKMWVGLDVGADQMNACIVDAAGDLIAEYNLANSAAALHSHLKAIKRRVALIALETGTFGVHLTRGLRRLGYPVAVFDSRQASKFLGIRQNKTDKNDARGLADVARLRGTTVSEVHVRSVECQRLRSALVTRQGIVRQRVAIESIIRAHLQLYGGKLKSSKSGTSLKRNVTDELRRLKRKEKVDLRDDIEPLLALAVAMRTYLENLEAQLLKTAMDHSVCKRFLDIPGVGPICALSFYTAVEDPARFSRNSDVGAYLGMVPKVRQSGQNTPRRRISKMGSAMTRSHLTTAALQHLRYGRGPLQSWGTRLADRIGKPRARVAVARKLAVLMTTLWKSGEPFDPNRGVANGNAPTQLVA